MNTKKRKKMTKAEKAMNAKIRAELREKGLIPQIKKRLNRQKFAKEVIENYREDLDKFEDIKYLFEGISWMLPNTEFKDKISLEQVGILKLLKIAMEIKTFYKKKIDEGEKTYSPLDMYKEVVQPILKL